MSGVANLPTPPGCEMAKVALLRADDARTMARDGVRSVLDAQAELKRELAGIRAEMRAGFAAVRSRDGQIVRDAEDSAQHKIEDLRRELEKREKADLENQLQAARASLRVRQQRAATLGWKLLEWAIIAAITAVLSHLAWH